MSEGLPKLEGIPEEEKTTSIDEKENFYLVGASPTPPLSESIADIRKAPLNNFMYQTYKPLPRLIEEAPISSLELPKKEKLSLEPPIDIRDFILKILEGKPLVPEEETGKTPIKATFPSLDEVRSSTSDLKKNE